ncbi:MAG: tyrosine-type recombinase/integrase [Sedimenticola sp.]
MSASRAHNTSLAYSTAMNAFFKFRQLYGMPPSWPASVEQLILFMSYCFEIGLSPSTIHSYIQGLNYYHKLHGWFEITSIFIISKLLEGCRRSAPSRDNRAPVTPNMLNSMRISLPLVCHNGYEASLFLAAFLLAYFGMFRVSELVAPSRCSLGTALLRSDVSFSADNASVSISLRTYKTKQRGPPTIIKLTREVNGDICPVRALHAFLRLRPNNVDTLFCHANGTPVSRSQFCGVLAKCLRVSGYHNQIVRSHSFRIGRATQLAASGVPTGAIMTMGRWLSVAYKTYIR